MEDRDFFELLYQTWSKTTGAEEMYWMPEAQDEDIPTHYNIVAVGETGSKKHVASFLSDEDADFITAVHGCLPDLIRALIATCDEADRLDRRVDEQTEEIAGLIQEVEHHREQAEYWKDHK